MACILFAAEADQIQDVIFRSSRLRQVVGGSQMLSRFCREAADELLKRYGGQHDNIIVKDGGAFRILFEDKDAERAHQTALRFGHDLAELYRRFMDCNMAFSEKSFVPDEFIVASTELDHSLRDKKRQGHMPETPVHLPYVAWCAACGVAIANRRFPWTKQEKKESQETENYYCETCYQKEMERDNEKKRIKKNDLTGFLGKFISRVQGASGKKLADPQQAEDVAQFDSRRNVAYLLADANNMGRFFSQCNKTEMRELSKKLRDIFYDALAAPCKLLLERIEELDKSNSLLPVLPLILGGDDVFALIPARWSIDFAAKFCEKFEADIEEFAKGNLHFYEKVSQPTITAAVVICKANYPYKLAYREGKKLLDETKKLAHRLELDGNPHSLLTFHVITGSQVPARDDGSVEHRYVPAFTPYFINNKDNDSFHLVKKLLDWRQKLEGLPGKRRAEFERLFEPDKINQIRDAESLNEWQKEYSDISRRIKRFQAESSSVNGVEGLSWHERDIIGRDRFNGHLLPDILKTWEYAYCLDTKLADYRRP